MSTADAVTRETAWLTTVDSLPPLLVASGGRWDVVQGYWPRTGAISKRGLYVQRTTVKVVRLGALRKLRQHHFQVLALWPMLSTTGNAESDQAAFDQAIDDVLVRIDGLTVPPVADKTHGGRFLSVAENPGTVDVVITPAEHAFASAPPVFSATISYWADDPEILA
jgi:hypothetical protein